MKKTIYILILLLFPPMVIELLSGSTPPVNYFNPFVLFFFAVTYGILFIFIRELKIKWQLGWSFLFLVPLVGIYIEGIFMQSFSNTGHMDLGHLSAFGMYYGIQWPWTIQLTIIHGLLSLCIPIYIIDTFFPSMKNATLLTRKNIWLPSILFIGLTLLQFYNIYLKTDPMYSDYDFDIPVSLFLLILCACLIWLAYHFKGRQWAEPAPAPKYTESDSKLFLVSFSYGIGTTIGIAFFAHIHLVLTLVFLCFMVYWLILAANRIIYQADVSRRTKMLMSTGYTSSFILLAIGQEYKVIPNLDPVEGMGIVAVCFILLFIALWLFIRRNESSPN